MNSKERILSAFKLKEPDKVPVSILVLSTWFDRADEKIAVDIIEQTDPIVSVCLNEEYGMEYNVIFGEKIKEYSKIISDKKETRVIIHTPKGDLFQTIEHREESDWVTEPLFKTTHDLEKFYSFPYEPYKEKSIYFDEYIYWKNIIKEQGLIVFETYNACSMLYLLLGPEKYYTTLMDDFNLVKSFTSVAGERIEEYVKIVMDSPIDKPAVFRMIGQEMLGSPMAKIKYFDELVVPHDSRLVKLIHGRGGLVYEHMHGNVRDVLERKIEIGANTMGPFEASPAGNISLKEVKDKLSGNVCVYGNIDDMKILASKDKRNIRLETFKAIRDAAEGGGYILGGTESSIYNMETAKSFILMSNISEIYGNYPINLKKIENKIKSLGMY
ncbi:MAG: uroporphyrinogen decarboxylase family protein [Candidatus Humimicrobiaceae bacterium]